ncbi:hypothetical protein ACFVQB_27780 [Paenibacillus sp. NPDC057886]|uniref:hypothetical protein n=1 Tax=Paenibacillus sp. NPDC057886 TaxID=3346270 RepID=UPI0036B31C28
MGDNKLDDLIPKDDNSNSASSQDVPMFKPRTSNEGSNPNVVEREHIPNFKSEMKFYQMTAEMANELMKKKPRNKK